LDDEQPRIASEAPNRIDRAAAAPAIGVAQPLFDPANRVAPAATHARNGGQGHCAVNAMLSAEK